MKVLVTGSSSIIGTATSERLLKLGDEVVGYDLKPGRIRHANFRAVSGDVMDLARLTEAAAECDAGLHLAALSGESDHLDIFTVNVVGTYAFLVAARIARFRISVLASSVPVHLPPGSFDTGLLNNSSEADTYDLSKSIQETIAADFHLHGDPVFCLRLGHVVYGEKRLNLDSPIPLEELDYCRGGWVALEDVVTASTAALGVQPDEQFRLYNLVGSREGRERFDVASTEARLGIKIKYDFT